MFSIQQKFDCWQGSFNRKNVYFDFIYKNGFKSVINDRRAINLTPSPSKLSEKLIKKEIFSCHFHYGLLNKYQLEFIKDRPFWLNFWRALIFGQKLFQRADQHCLYWLWKGLDKISHVRLTETKESFSTLGSLLVWLCNFLNQRTQKKVAQCGSFSQL